jgi:uncharacterized repeat protein (TIGR01451 family)
MRHTGDETAAGRLLAGRVGWALLALILGILVVAAGPAWAETQTGPSVSDGPEKQSGSTLFARQASTVTLPAWALKVIAADHDLVAEDELAILKSASTGLDNSTAVYNGETITYTITVSNPTSKKATNIILLDVLPKNTLASETISCGDGCAKIYDEELIPGPLGGTIVVTVTRQISWEVSSLAAGASIVRTFSGQVVGQSDGIEVKNRAFLNYSLGGVVKTGISNETATIVRVRVDEPGQASFSSAPTWFSSDMGGTIGMDWGDWNDDGYLDLALGSTIGTTAYRNDRGRLKAFWDDDPRTYGVSWGDFDQKEGLELAAVGLSIDGTAATSGTNFLYSLAGSRFIGTEFGSNYQIVRTAPGDYSDDGYLDLMLSTNSINAPCPVLFYPNSQDAEKPFLDEGFCIANEATAAISPVDYDNDGDMDLALGQFPNLTYLLRNTGSVTATPPYTALVPAFASELVEDLAEYLPYDFSWGDYNGDGFLDLAIAFPLERRVRIYRNDHGKTPRFVDELRTNLFRTPLSVEWGDFTGDGRLDLAVADSPPQIYRYRVNPNTGEDEFVQVMRLNLTTAGGAVWSIRAADLENDGDLDLALSNDNGPSMIFTNFAPLLRPSLKPITFTGSAAVSSVAWGDADVDGDLDLLFGAGEGAVATKLYSNETVKGSIVFPKDLAEPFLSSGFGPHGVAFGDVNRDFQLDIAIAVGTSSGSQLYLAGNTESPDWTSAPPHFPAYSAAWGDADDDGDLDLLLGRQGPNALYLNQDGQLATNPVWITAETDNTRSVAWGDMNGDRYLDIAVGNDGQPSRIYRNNRDGTFDLVWSSPKADNTNSVAWADYDGDGYLDLAVGNRGQANKIYRNEEGQFGDAPVWRSATRYQTTSLAWGDWDNDGDLDLAVGNDGDPDQVYANLTSKPGSPPQLYWVWTSGPAYHTSSLAWGDMDGDGDLDLAVGQAGTDRNGIYENTYIMPSHLTDKFAITMPLANNPSYVAVQRPGNTPAAYFYSSAELLSGPNYPTVTIHYTLFDPDGTRDDSVFSDAPGARIVDTDFEYSLDGGATWKSATSITTSTPCTTTSRLGEPASFLWDAVTDKAISDNARFRVRIVPQSLVGPVQRSATSAISPPFRIRGTSCVWPRKPTITVVTRDPMNGDEIEFQGSVLEASDVLTYTWDFGDGTDLVRGQVVYHTYFLPGTYQVTMTARSRPCPIVKEVFATKQVFVAQGPTTLYTPLTFKSYPRVTGDLPASLSPPDEESGSLRSRAPEPPVGGSEKGGAGQ